MARLRSQPVADATSTTTIVSTVSQDEDSRFSSFSFRDEDDQREQDREVLDDFGFVVDSGDIVYDEDMSNMSFPSLLWQVPPRAPPW